MLHPKEALSLEIGKEDSDRLRAEAERLGISFTSYASMLLSLYSAKESKTSKRRFLSNLLGKKKIQRLWDEALDTSDLLSDEDCRNLAFVFIYSLMHLNLLLLKTRDDEWPAELQGALEILTTIGNSANIMDGTSILLRKRSARRKRPSVAEQFPFAEDEE